MAVVPSHIHAALRLADAATARVPGMQYVVVSANGTLFENVTGFADIGAQRAMTPDTTLMAYSMTKTFTAAAIMQLVERGAISLGDVIDKFLPDQPFNGKGITLRHLLTHTSGIPNPIPLRWVHLAIEHADFNEGAALKRLLDRRPALAFEPGQRYLYSNIGYWLLGKIIEQVSDQPYVEYMREHVLKPLGLISASLDFEIANASRHAGGYLEKYSMMNAVKRLLIDSSLWRGYEGSWLRFNDHYLNGPAFGGLVGSARGVARFLRDQLRGESALFNASTKQLFETPLATRGGNSIPMTLGWHVGELHGTRYLYKEGGGGGFHCEMRLYSTRGIGTVVMTNSTQFNSSRFLNRVDGPFLTNAH